MQVYATLGDVKCTAMPSYLAREVEGVPIGPIGLVLLIPRHDVEGDVKESALFCWGRQSSPR